MPCMGITQHSGWAPRRRGRRRYPRCGKVLTLLLLCSELSSSELFRFELFRSELVESVFLHMVPEGNNGG